MAPLPKVRFGDWIGEGWNMFAEQWKVWVLDSLILFLVTVVPIMGMYIFMLFGVAASGGAGSAAIGFSFVLLMLIVAVLLVTLASYVVYGMYQTAFKQLRGEPISTSDLFSPTDGYLRFLGAAIVVAILGMIGALLCIIPAFIVAGALYFTVPLVVERRMGVGEAIQASRDATRGDLFMFILFAFVVSLIAQAGSYLCYVGLLVTWPLQYTIIAVAYRDCFGVAGARSFAKKAVPPHAYGAAPPPDYTPAPYQPTPGYESSQPPSAVYQPLPVAAPINPTPQPAWGGSVQEQKKMITCPDCQAQLPTTARFCARCGRTLVDQ